MTQPTDVTPVISVVIPSTRPDVRGGQLRALAAQDFDRPWEIVIVTTESLPTSATRPLPCPVHVVATSARRGPSEARNRGVAHAQAPLLAFCDDDDEVSSGWLRSLVDALGDADAAGGPLDLEQLNDARTIAIYGFDVHGDRFADVWASTPFAETSNLAIRRSVFEDLGGFHEPMRSAEDRDLAARLHVAGYSLVFVPDAVVHRRLRRSTKEMVRQAHGWAHGEVLLYRRHRVHGMPRSAGGRSWLRLVRDVPQLLSSTTRVAWLRRLGERVGRLSGSVRYRTWYL